MAAPCPAVVPLFPPARVRTHLLARRLDRAPAIARQVVVVTGADGIDRVVDRRALSAADAAALVGGA